MTDSLADNMIFRKDYRQPDFYIPDLELTIDLKRTASAVRGKLYLARNSDASDLVLSKGSMEIKRVALDGIETARFTVSDENLVIPEIGVTAVVEIDVEINPEKNLALEGLYLSGGIYSTQNEPEGFRRIIPFIDRPDNMTRITTTIIGDRDECPVMLSNGNIIDEGDAGAGRHFVTWRDPFPKPVYLFALVAGRLGMIESVFTTGSGREVLLRVYSDPGNEEKCRHALASLEKAMAWDEQRFNLEYDLDTYMIVAVDSFNMGAMENKGLNIFNSQFVLADEATATDNNFLGIESVVAHEYFHNWTGNRITCRDWFQLTLKEGLTVFRDQEFSSDVQSRPLQRIGDVDALRRYQFPEDAGPMAHPVRPDSYMEINNFYTVTVYEKGAEIIRMIHSILGEEKFMAGMARYVELFDGQAVTCDDFVFAMEEGSGVELGLFRNWYSQSGTPRVQVETDYDCHGETFTISLTQNTPATADQKEKQLLHIPLSLALFGKDGNALSLSGSDSAMIHLKEKQLQVTYSNIPEQPVLSLNRFFTAPVILEYDRPFEDELFLFRYDTDPVNRWDAGQRIYSAILENSLDMGGDTAVPDDLLGALEKVVNDTDMDSMFAARLLSLPGEEILAEGKQIIHIAGIFNAIESLRKSLADSLAPALRNLVDRMDFSLSGLPYEPSREQSGKRALRLKALGYLVRTGHAEDIERAARLYYSSANMTDALGSLAVLVAGSHDHADKALADFYKTWKSNNLVMQKWLAVQASAPGYGTEDRIKRLEQDPVFDREVPNCVRALYRSFASNWLEFHHQSGSGYEFIAEKILELDSSNPSMASSLAGAYRYAGRLDQTRNERMIATLNRIMNHNLSKNTREIIGKTLQVNRT